MADDDEYPPNPFEVPCDRYILDANGDPEVCPNLFKWGRFMSQLRRRRVAESYLTDGSRVSTMFMGLDMGMGRIFAHAGPPLLFETMVFLNPHARDYDDEGFEDIDQLRYSTWTEAFRGHYHLVALWETQIAKTTLRLSAIVDELAQAQQRREQPATQHDAADLVGLGSGEREQVEDQADDGNDDGGGDCDAHGPRVFPERSRI